MQAPSTLVFLLLLSYLLLVLATLSAWFLLTYRQAPRHRPKRLPRTSQAKPEESPPRYVPVARRSREAGAKPDTVIEK